MCLVFTKERKLSPGAPWVSQMIHLASASWHIITVLLGKVQSQFFGSSDQVGLPYHYQGAAVPSSQGLSADPAGFVS
jgi:hypothetical protein